MMEQVRKIMAAVEAEASGKENGGQLARRPDVSLVGRSQALTPIRKLHKVRNHFLERLAVIKYFFSAHTYEKLSRRNVRKWTTFPTAEWTKGMHVLYAFGCSQTSSPMTLKYAGFSVHRVKTGCIPIV